MQLPLSIRLFTSILLALGASALISTGAGARQAADSEFQAKPLSKSINTNADEFGPVISASGKKIFFVRAKPNTEKGHDIWVSSWKRGRWMPPESIGKNVNGQAMNGLGGVSSDGNSLYVTNVYDEFGNVSGSGISKSKRDGFNWLLPEPIWDASGIAMTGTFGFHAVEGEQLFLLSMQDTTRGYGAEDLYALVWQDSAWSEPLSLGENINTEGSEFAPFLANNGQLLFFSSNGHGGEGSSDIFMSRRTGSKWDEWSKPINLGKEVNTPDFDAYFVMDATSTMGYYSTAPSAGEWGDIYTVDLALVPALQDSVPRAEVASLIDTVQLEEPKEEEASISTIAQDTASTQEVAVLEVDTLAQQLPVVVKEEPLIEKQPEPVNYEEVFEEVVNREDVVFDNVLFDFNDYKLKGSEKEKVNRMIDFMKKHPEMGIKLNGYTDSVGSDSINVVFGNARCVSVRNYMTLKGVAPSRVEIYSYGEKSPLKGTAAINRRVEVFLVRPEKD